MGSFSTRLAAEVAPATLDEISIQSNSRPSARNHHHAVQFYDDEAFLATTVSAFLKRGLEANEPAVVIATAPHRKSFTQRLAACGVDVEAAVRTGQLVMLDARRTLRSFLRQSRPDGSRFRSVIGAVLDKSLASRPGATVHAYGEMVDLLWKDGNIDGAMRLEDLWNELAASYSFSLLCAYSMANFSHASDSASFAMVCGQHTHVTPTERYVAQADDAQRLLQISLLEQRARSLEAEIRERQALEQRLRETVAALEQREEDLRDVLENAVEGIHLVGPDGVIQWANNAELEMLGYRPEEYIGRPITAFHVDRDAIDELLRRLSVGETMRNYPARLRHKDGSIRHVLVNSNVRWEHDEFRHTRCFTRDITDAMQANAERERAFERERAARAEAERAQRTAEQANRAKSEFLAVMSHELRTPLNAIGGYAELMELGVHGPATPQQRESLERIQRSQRALLGLVNQVLNYARVETGNVRYELADIALDDALRSTEGLIAPQIRSKGLRYVYTGCDSALRVRADGEKLQQIVLNLLTNASKFTDRGGSITLAVECVGQRVHIRVSDTGIGISPDKLTVIFDPFVQVDSNYTRTRDGVGLGLAISRDLARGMDGELTAESTEGMGSTFTLEMPRSDL